MACRDLAAAWALEEDQVEAAPHVHLAVYFASTTVAVEQSQSLLDPVVQVVAVRVPAQTNVSFLVPV